jgi:hypothetical protein
MVALERAVRLGDILKHGCREVDEVVGVLAPREIAISDDLKTQTHLLPIDRWDLGANVWRDLRRTRSTGIDRRLTTLVVGALAPVCLDELLADGAKHRAHDHFMEWLADVLAELL